MKQTLIVFLLIVLCAACGATPPGTGDGPPEAPNETPNENPNETPDPRPEDPDAAPADPLHDTIAYVTANGDAIRLIGPDGGDDRPLWDHGLADEHDVHAVWSLAWNPAATELAFASTHENGCSLNHVDLFAVAADGSSSRRVTQAPACADLDPYPTGTVRVTVRNSSLDTFDGFLYFQGAPGPQQVSLPPGGSATVVFEDVADFGSGEEHLQVGAIIVGAAREYAFSTVVDVVAGGSVTTGVTDVYLPAGSWESRSPTWSPDGERLGHVLNFGSLWQVGRAPVAGDFGSALLADDVDMPSFSDHLAWGPTAATADRLLYAATEPFESTTIRLVREGAADAGEAVLAFDSTESVGGLAWLPDGSGFVFSVTEGEYFGEDRSANLFVHDLATAITTRVTGFVGEFAGRVSVSPDGERFVFERGASSDTTTGALAAVDLWLVGRDGDGLELLVEDAYAPAWSH